jgi:hypothetical protein
VAPTAKLQLRLRRKTPSANQHLLEGSIGTEIRATVTGLGWGTGDESPIPYSRGGITSKTSRVSVPIFLWVGLTCFAFIPLWRAFSGEHYKLEQRLERHPQRAGWGGWSFIEQLAVIMGIISFIIQVAQWVYLWL